jgi:hypothetical protein
LLRRLSSAVSPAAVSPAAVSPAAVSPADLSSDARGVVIVEYVVVLLLVSMFACGAILLLGMAISKFYFSQEAWIGIPLP